MVAPLTPPATASTNRRSLAAIVALALVAATAFGASRFHDADELHHPSAWDHRVVDLVQFVERERGLDFEHPVSVYFLNEAEYTEVITGGAAYEPTEDEREDAGLQLEMLRALGVVDGEPDLLASNETIADSGTLAFYDTDRDVVNVRGEELTVGLRVTLVHELVHALQDQHFDVVEQVNGTDPEAASAARAVVEGDAVNVEQAYVAGLSEAELEEYEAESVAAADGAESDLEEVPEFLTTVFAAPYYLGPSFVALFGSTRDGSVSPSRVDGILDRPPLTMGHLFDPRARLDGIGVARVPSPLEDDDAFDRSTLGAIVLFSMLASRIDPVVALDATDGWRGDAYTAVETGDDPRMCVTADFAMATADDAAELTDALDAWALTMPNEADVEIDAEDGGGAGHTVTLRSCDPGADADLTTSTSYGEALLLPVVRLQLAFGQTLAGVDAAVALCVSDIVIRELTVDDLTAEELSPELERRLAELTSGALDSC